jgi:hypothetical protein
MKADEPTLVIVNERAGGGAMRNTFRRVEHDLVDRVGDFDVVVHRVPRATPPS